jgi:Protein of unknown function (DUF3048) N-terminal domain/Protein of unknown function (DUF3048) C-terminal domain
VRLDSRMSPRLSGPVGLLLVASLALAGCSGGDDESAEPETVEVTHADGTVEEVPAEPATWPLTGIEVAKGSADATHPVLVTKMDNTPSSAPQIGLGKADLVIEELVEGGVTRLAAFYYSQMPGTVGPVRSMRASDIGIVTPVQAQVVTSGAAQITLNRVSGAGIKFVTEGAKGVYRDENRYAPYNLFANLQDITAGIKQKAARPEDYLPWGTAGDLPKGVKATKIGADFGNHTTSWEYRKGGYTNVNTYAAEGDHFPAETVLVLRVQVGDAGYRDPAGYPVPETKFVGTGPALLFHDGRLVRGTWSKKQLTSPLKLATKGGDLTVPAGRTWIELVPALNGDVTFTK